ncbi:PIR Superfamily Protein [Plasmodium ovale wallikeri]|uniref:PIR Superfamily Protein n=1 Tax=Plasmodium ovale wallikeri TaxID=864142 RepID=A0A1A9A6F7_PLAOA|nr:PIR Superfamily Protein [Plasmodium ovale wallikeri]SBT55540.1 PIR Superfamily Protein [Plasmodium ovale wallikeri]
MTSIAEEEYYNAVSKLPTDKCRLNITIINPIREQYEALCEMKGKTHLKDEKDFIDHCVKVTSYIENFYENCPIKDNPKHCKFFNYILNEEVRNNRYTKYNDVMLMNAYKDISSEMGICKDDVEFIQQEDFTKINDLHNMNYKLKSFLNNINDSGYNCREVNNSVDLYKSYEHETLPSFGIIGAEDDESEMQGSFHDGDEVLVASSGLGFSRSNILIAFSSLLLIFFIIFILYKFTPVGPWILPQIRNMKQNLNNIFKEILHFFYKSKTQRINTQKNQINLQYLSLENE